MEHLLLPLKVVLPILLQLGLGWFLHRKGALSAPFLQTLNALVFRLFLPVMMFGNISSGGAVPSVRLTAFAAVSVSALFLLLFLRQENQTVQRVKYHKRQKLELVCV